MATPVTMGTHDGTRPAPARSMNSAIRAAINFAILTVSYAYTSKKIGRPFGAGSQIHVTESAHETTEIPGQRHCE
ncbi:hypothetical protein [Komagataeibacter sp. FNDCF1]|uniref:hypothetical protein n=1 Tax=Komagataeibacter sp. FNDCF1 TaxID=2878681 RepID=UPI001E291274|nr:hypothetical protein [Komagataeibacter sp. FNDCF1]MCE2566099.1 hypothetical protein [Komagataeibacter sp. FNDCF1]